MNIAAELSQLPHWNEMSAYERAQACCQLLSQKGQPIPGWMQLRQWIGKGSANDIHRAKQDFLQGDQPSVAAAKADGLPPALTGTLDAWWQQLRQTAADEFAEQTVQWQQQLDDAAARCVEYQQQIQAHQAQIAQQQQQIDALQAQLHASEHSQREAEDGQLRAESSLQALQLAFGTWQAEQAQQQRDVWQAAIEQLSGLQDFATSQIEQARQQAQSQIALQQQQSAQQLVQIQQHYNQSLAWLEHQYRQTQSSAAPSHRLIRRGMRR